MLAKHRYHGFGALLLMMVIAPQLRATMPTTTEAAEHSIKQFLAQGDSPRPYRATRRLEARNGDSVGWLKVTTEVLTGVGLPLHHHQRGRLRQHPRQGAEGDPRGRA